MTTPPNTPIETIVMRRVRIIRMLRPIFSATTASVLVLAGSLAGIGRAVWVARVLDNAPHDLTRVPSFYYAAFMNTDVNVEALTLVCAISALILTRASFRAVQTTVSAALA